MGLSADRLKSVPKAFSTMMGLELAYGRARDIIGRERAECLEAAVEVDRLRQAYGPERVRVVVLAESHVWTSRDEIRSHVVMPNGIETRFVRFVYCLGYGEPQLVVPAVTPNRMGVSHQFWRLFHDTVHEPTISRVPVIKAGTRKSVCRTSWTCLRRCGAPASGWSMRASLPSIGRAHWLPAEMISAPSSVHVGNPTSAKWSASVRHPQS
jgi:hypothetical protein